VPRRAILPLLCAVVLSATVTFDADSQIIRGRVGSLEPPAWMDASIGLILPGTIRDGNSQAAWDFGSGTLYRVALTKTVPGSGAIGVAFGYARTPLKYRRFDPIASGGSTTCLSDCSADATIMQAMATLHGGDGRGIHGVYELSIGLTSYSSFASREDGSKLGPASNDFDLTFLAGYGFAYTMSSRSEIELMQGFTTSVHQKGGLDVADGNLPRSAITRLGVRFGVGK
jgi:hypothetical protein